MTIWRLENEEWKQHETTKPFSDDWIRLKCATRWWAHSCGVGFVSGWKLGIWIRRAAFNEISGATTSLNLRFMRINACRFHWPISRPYGFVLCQPAGTRRLMHSASCTPVALRMASMDLWPSLWRHRETTGSRGHHSAGTGSFIATKSCVNHRCLTMVRSEVRQSHRFFRHFSQRLRYWAKQITSSFWQRWKAWKLWAVSEGNGHRWEASMQRWKFPRPWSLGFAFLFPNIS